MKEKVLRWCFDEAECCCPSVSEQDCSTVKCPYYDWYNKPVRKEGNNEKD